MSIDKNEAPEGFEAVSDDCLKPVINICEFCDYAELCADDPEMRCTNEYRKDKQDVFFKKSKVKNEQV